MKNRLLAPLGITVLALLLTSSALPHSSEVIVSPAAEIGLEVQVEKAIQTIEDNLAAGGVQQVEERQKALNELSFPQGAEARPPEILTDLTVQLDQLRHATAATIEPPMTVIYEQGYFSATIALDWQCAWISDALLGHETGDSQRVMDAVDTLEGFSDSRLAVHFPDYQVFMEMYVAPITQGEPTIAYGYLDGNCLPESQVNR